MPVIAIRFKDKSIREHSIIIGQNCTIGRKDANDIVIDNLAVSGFHAQIDSVSTTFVLRDLNSTNGTFVNNKKVSMHNLKHNDAILIGKHELIFDCSDIIRMQANKANSFDDEKTRVLDTNEFRKLTGRKSTIQDEAPSSPAGIKENTAAKKTSLLRLLMQKLFR